MEKTSFLILLPIQWKSELQKLSESTGKSIGTLIKEAIQEKYNLSDNLYKPIAMTCQKCHYGWNSRKDNPRTCPKCRSPYWNSTSLEDKLAIKLRKRNKEYLEELEQSNIEADKLKLITYVWGMYPDAELDYFVETKKGRFCLNIAIPRLKIDFEYDWNWAGDDPEELKMWNDSQDTALKADGWTIIRIGKDEVDEFVGNKK